MSRENFRIVKRYVKVSVLFSESGMKTPKAIFWDHGKRYEIDRILDVRQEASAKAGGQGERYLCSINGRVHKLFFEDPAWFVEEKVYR